MQQRSILIVEDEILIRLATGQFFREVGYTVLEASNGDEARKLFEAGEVIDALFSDVTMEGHLDGLGLAAWVRAHFPHTKIILTSGATGLKRPTGLDAYDGFFDKPYQPDDVTTLINRLVPSRHRAEDIAV